MLLTRISDYRFTHPIPAMAQRTIDPGLVGSAYARANAVWIAGNAIVRTEALAGSGLASLVVALCCLRVAQIETRGIDTTRGTQFKL
jgi:hypothetical protein